MKNIINISDFNEIISGLKAMKADLVCINGNILIGTDSNNRNIKIYQMNITIPIKPFTILTKELSGEFFANITDTNIILDFEELKIYCPNNKSFSDSKINKMITDEFTTDYIISRYISMLDEISYSNHIIIGDILLDEYFVPYKELKTSDGTYLYNPGGSNIYGMYIYNGAIPLNKMDKVSLEIYDSGETFISRFIVYKKKLNPIHIYFKFVKLNNTR